MERANSIPVGLSSHTQYLLTQDIQTSQFSSVSPSAKIDPTKFGPAVVNHTAAGIILFQSMSRQTGV